MFPDARYVVVLMFVLHVLAEGALGPTEPCIYGLPVRFATAFDGTLVVAGDFGGGPPVALLGLSVLSTHVVVHVRRL